ncbi:hypothetical protein ACQJBY_071117 [Aegilops geniculata]
MTGSFSDPRAAAGWPSARLPADGLAGPSPRAFPSTGAAPGSSPHASPPTGSLAPPRAPPLRRARRPLPADGRWHLPIRLPAGVTRPFPTRLPAGVRRPLPASLLAAGPSP